MMRANNRATRLVAAAALALCAGAAVAQSPGGLVGQAVTRLREIDGAAPGFLYYGVNGADRGLGYNGSYMTLGGFIPFSEDDLGGFWAADLRGHLSTYGGFFSNVGAVRKQFIGGTLLGVGVYWDYDGDMNQYPTWGQIGTEPFGQFGHAYNQVGVSGEWLTDYGNIRSNGYMPVGPTAHTLGAPGIPFVQNYILCDYGLDAALGGADLEVGAYIPGLADWAGMVSVGGYALGNARYDWWQGTQAGQAVVPWFGGVYTRLDMTFARNWDFSLQANNDSHFDWTGFARLTYRMGGSRRRNVPDQVEQPMMRNEHIVRTHQTPIVAVNPVTGAAWNVIHVDSAATVGGNGTAETPVQTLAQAQSLAVNPYDIVFVHTGSSAASSPYASNWQFQADDQILVGEGSTLQLNTLNCGYEQFFRGTGPATAYPVLALSGTAITLRNGAIVDHFQVVSAPVAVSPAPVAIAADASLTGTATVNDVQVLGTPGRGEVGVQIAGVPAGGTVNLYNMLVQDTDTGLLVDGGAADVNFQGMIEHADASGPAIVIQNTTGGTINVNRTADTLDTPVARNQLFTQSFGILDTNSQAAEAIAVSFNTDTIVNIGQTRISLPGAIGVLVAGGTNTQVSFTNLVVQDAVAQAFFSQSNDANSLIAIDGFSTLSSQSTLTPTFQTNNDDAALAVTLAELDSQVTLNTNSAIILQGASTGFLTITDQFLVSGTPGTVAGDVTNVTTGIPPVTVTVP